MIYFSSYCRHDVYDIGNMIELLSFSVDSTEEAEV